MKEKLSPYLPGIILFVVTLILGLAIYKDYGMGWDEPLQRDPAVLSWNYVVHGDQTLFKTETDNHGAGFELVLLFEFDDLVIVQDSENLNAKLNLMVSME